MSATVRQQLAEAASLVEGIHVTPYFRQTTKAGDGMVRLDRIEYPNPFGGIARWQVLIVLPKDIASAEQYQESKVPAVVSALRPFAVVTTVTPQQLATGDGTIPVAVIDMHREED